MPEESLSSEFRTKDMKCYFVVVAAAGLGFVAFLVTVAQLVHGSEATAQHVTDDGRPIAVRDQYFWAEKTLKALRRLLEYAYGKADQFNLDGMVGLRMAHGQLRVLLKRTGHTIPTVLRDEINGLTTLAGQVIDRALPFIAASTPSYYKQMGTVLKEGFFEHDYNSRHTNASLVYKDVKIEDKFTEVLSDSCLSELQGTGASEGRPCTVSDECWDLMTAPHYKDYALAHQVLYLLVAEAMQCGAEVGRVNDMFCRLRGRCHTLSELQETLCANVVDGMNSLEARGFPGNTRDLFLEHVAVCGILGFRDVCTVHRLKMMLSWQEPSGCFVRGDGLGHSGHRQKRYDVLIDDGCSAHKSSVAAGALGVCIRFHVEEPFPNTDS